MCLDWESNPQALGVWDDVPTNWATWPGPAYFNFSIFQLLNACQDLLVSQRVGSESAPSLMMTGSQTLRKQLLKNVNVIRNPVGLQIKWARGVSWLTVAKIKAPDECVSSFLKTLGSCSEARGEQRWHPAACVFWDNLWKPQDVWHTWNLFHSPKLQDK